MGSTADLTALSVKGTSAARKPQHHSIGSEGVEEPAFKQTTRSSGRTVGKAVDVKPMTRSTDGISVRHEAPAATSSSRVTRSSKAPAPKAKKAKKG
ncbi:hypothetical protein NUW54_g2988 [Trametes sanguinea]|uniref:Uncharacterized protein n=1 Tax=Trametes sanguinea TaxID=158606 RepID=A0ACC1Q387_9APHY|nr:hypothetical protein NUW54_g2988 [Trametes sanguinea]